MKCPEKSALCDLLGGCLFESQSSLVLQHVESCAICQRILDQLSDDSDLQVWRDSGHFEIEQAELSNAYQAMIKRLANVDTKVSSISVSVTVDESGRIADFISKLGPSSFEGDLGLLDHYRILREVGHGGTANVFEAIDTILDRIVALKVLRTEQVASLGKERFAREARAIAGVKHPNVISIYGIHTSVQGPTYIAMEWIGDGSIRNRIQKELEIDPRVSAKWISEIANGLSEVHKLGLVHRDIKPNNILLSNSNGEFIAKLADFGLARISDASPQMTQSGILVGTPSYLSPEYIANSESCDARSDIYSLGVTLYEMLTGTVPFRGAIHTVLQRIGNDDPPNPRSLNARIPRDLEIICLKAMHRDPCRRYATSMELSDDLNRWQTGMPILARPASSAELLIRWSHRNRKIAAMTAAIAVLLITIAIGSSYAALTLRVAERQLRNEKEKVERTSSELISIADQAQRAAEEAKKQRQIAIESLNSLVTKVQIELASRPGTLKIRQALLDTALSGLNRITSDVDSSTVDSTMIEAHFRKGEILDLLGKTSAALPEFELAVSMAQETLNTQPDSLQSARTLAKALIMQADMHRKAFAYDLALPILMRARALSDRVAEELPNDSDAQYALQTTVQKIADIHFSRNDVAAAELAFSQLLQLATHAAKTFPANNVVRRGLGIAQERLGTLYTMLGGRNELASQQLMNSIATVESLIALEPENITNQANLAWVKKRLASLQSQLGDHELAAATAREAIELYAMVANSDLLDTDANMKLGAGWDQLYSVLLAARDLEGAIDALSKSATVFEKLAIANPTASKYAILSAAAYLKLGQVQVRQGLRTDSLMSVRNSVRFSERGQDAADAQPGYFTFDITIGKKYVEALELSLSSRNVLENSGEHEPDVWILARVYSMYEYARTGEIERAFEIGRILTESLSQDAYIAILQQYAAARAFSRCYGHLVKIAASDLKASELAYHAKSETIRMLEILLSIFKDPVARRECEQEIDFDSVRQTAEFERLFQ